MFIGNPIETINPISQDEYTPSSEYALSKPPNQCEQQYISTVGSDGAHLS
jgi:hypothetical protein